MKAGRIRQPLPAEKPEFEPHWKHCGNPLVYLIVLPLLFCAGFCEAAETAELHEPGTAVFNLLKTGRKAECCPVCRQSTAITVRKEKSVKGIRLSVPGMPCRSLPEVQIMGEHPACRLFENHFLRVSGWKRTVQVRAGPAGSFC